MSSVSDRALFVIIDDADPRVEYFGGWERTANVGNSPAGQLYNGTQSSTTTDTASFKFTFNGTAIFMNGAVDTTKGMPVWECFVDRDPIFLYTLNNGTQGNQFYCGSDSLGEGEHIFEFYTKSEQKIWLDMLQYRSLQGFNLYAETVYLSALDEESGIQFLPESAWSEFDGNDDGVADTKFSSTRGSTMNFAFNGTAVTALGIEQFGTDNTATYVIDDERPTEFRLIGSGQDDIGFNHVLFKVSDLDPNVEHKLVVEHTGSDSEDSVPLEVQGFYITTAGAPSLDVETSQGSSSSEETGGGSSTPVGAIVGGVIGGVALIALIAVGIFLFWRKRRSRQGTRPLDLSNSDYESRPFVLTPPVSSSTSPPQSSAPSMAMSPNSQPIYATDASQAPVSMPSAPPTSYGTSVSGAPSSSGGWTVANASSSDQQGPSTASGYGGGASKLSEKEQLRLKAAQASLEEEEEAPPPQYSAHSP